MQDIHALSVRQGIETHLVNDNWVMGEEMCDWQLGKENQCPNKGTGGNSQVRDASEHQACISPVPRAQECCTKGLCGYVETLKELQGGETIQAPGFRVEDLGLGF